MKSLIREIKADNAKVVLFAFREAPVNGYNEAQLEGYEKNRGILKGLGAEFSVPFVPFPQNIISTENWVDNCHVNARGALEKARYLVPFIKKYINRD